MGNIGKLDALIYQLFVQRKIIVFRMDFSFGVLDKIVFSQWEDAVSLIRIW
jgi:hypothetical protein